jgi:hypothetical protein
MANSPARQTPCDRAQIVVGWQNSGASFYSSRDSAEGAPGSDRVSCTAALGQRALHGPKLQADTVADAVMRDVRPVQLSAPGSKVLPLCRSGKGE